MDTNQVAKVSRALRIAATNRRLLPYVKFHALFERTVPLSKRQTILESAICSFADISAIDYGVLLACDNGLPGADFYLRYRKYRLEDFVRVMGDPRYCGQSRKRQQILADQERERVFSHVLALRQLQDQWECA